MKPFDPHPELIQAPPPQLMGCDCAMSGYPVRSYRDRSTRKVPNLSREAVSGYQERPIPQFGFLEIPAPETPIAPPPNLPRHHVVPQGTPPGKPPLPPGAGAASEFFREYGKRGVGVGARWLLRIWTAYAILDFAQVWYNEWVKTRPKPVIPPNFDFEPAGFEIVSGPGGTSFFPPTKVGGAYVTTNPPSIADVGDLDVPGYYSPPIPQYGPFTQPHPVGVPGQEPLDRSWASVDTIILTRQMERKADDFLTGPDYDTRFVIDTAWSRTSPGVEPVFPTVPGTTVEVPRRSDTRVSIRQRKTLRLGHGQGVFEDGYVERGHERRRENDPRRKLRERALVGRAVVTAPGTGAGVGTVPPNHTDSPPKARTRERKVRANKQFVRVIWWAANFVTESADMIGAIWDALPDYAKTGMKQVHRRKVNGGGTVWVKKYHPTPQEMMQDLWDHWRAVDINEMMWNIVRNQLTDAAIGKVASKINQNAQWYYDLTKRPTGFLSGPWDTQPAKYAAEYKEKQDKEKREKEK